MLDQYPYFQKKLSSRKKEIKKLKPRSYVDTTLVDNSDIKKY